MASIIVEYSFDEPMADETLSGMAKRLDDCLEIRDGAWVRSSLSADRQRMICEFEAPDAESVEKRCGRRADVRLRLAATVFAAELPDHLAKVRAIRSKATGRRAPRRRADRPRPRRPAG